MAGITAGKCGEFMCRLRNYQGAGEGPIEGRKARKTSQYRVWKRASRAENWAVERKGDR